MDIWKCNFVSTAPPYINLSSKRSKLNTNDSFKHLQNMKHVYKTKPYFLVFLFLIAFTINGIGQNIVSYAYDNACNRITRKIVLLCSNPMHIKIDTIAPAPVEEQLGERKITVYPNPTKGELKVDITGGNIKDEISIRLINAKVI